MAAKRQHRIYTKEFKEEAVKLVLEQNYTVQEAARSLGITGKILYNWKKKYEEEQSGDVLTKVERSELIRLRKENKRLQMEREILKKASAFFAKEMK